MSATTLWDAVVGPWPVALPGDAASPRWGDGAGARLRGATVLVVENEPRLLDAMTDALAEICPRVIGCADAGEGLGAFGLLRGPAVLVVNAGLEGLSAQSLAEAFRDAAPQGAVVFITESGYGMSVFRMLGARDALLRRPFGGRELRAAVRRAAALASGGPPLVRHQREGSEQIQ